MLLLLTLLLITFLSSWEGHNMPDYNVTLWKQIADEQGIDYSGYSPTSLRYEETWIRIVGGNAVGQALDSQPFAPSQDYLIAREVENMPDKENLVGLWLFGYDPTNQIVRDWSGNDNEGLRGGSTTPNTSNPEGTNFDGSDDFVRVLYAANMYTASTGSVTLGSVAAQSVAGNAVVVSQSFLGRTILYGSNGDVFGYFSKSRYAASQRVLNTLEHYMVTGDGLNVNIYKNGTLSNGVTANTYDANANNQPLYIGQLSAGRNYFTGDIHCVYLYTSNQSANAAIINTRINNILAILEDQNV